MRLHTRILLFALATVVIFGTTAAITPAAPRNSSTVKVETSTGFGSGVYLGKGAVLTAAHVVGDDKEVTLLTEAGARTPAEVLWANAQYDVALMRASLADVARSTLTCSTAQVGDELKTVGHPDEEMWMTLFGRVAKEPREVDNWRSVLRVDMTGAPGISGAPVFNRSGYVAGIVVATMAKVSWPTHTLHLVVPSSAICGLMGR